MAEVFLEFTGLMVDYLANCDVFDTEARPEDLEQMRNLFIQKGAEAVKGYLTEIHQPYYEILNSESEKTFQTDALLQIDDGMRVKQLPNEP